jgi:hypothetical protein
MRLRALSYIAVPSAAPRAAGVARRHELTHEELEFIRPATAAAD